MRLLRTVFTLLAVGTLASVAVAQDDWLQTLAGFHRDHAVTQGAGDNMLRVVATYAKPITNEYVAYVRLSWGQLDSVSTVASNVNYRTWNGELTVGDGGSAFLVSTEGFEANRQVIQPFDANAYHEAVRKWQQGRASLIQRSAQRRLDERRRAAERIADKRELLAQLAKIDRQHTQRVAKFDRKMEAALVELRQRVGETVVIDPDRITQDGGSRIAWQATTRGDSDSILVKLVLTDPYTTVSITAGEHKVSFNTNPAPDAAQSTTVVSTDYRRALYGASARPHTQHMTVYKKYLRTQPVTSSYYGNSYYGSSSYYRSGWGYYPSIYVGSGYGGCYRPRRSYVSHYRGHGYRSGASVRGGVRWSGGHVRVGVNSGRSHGGSHGGHHSSGGRGGSSGGRGGHSGSHGGGSRGGGSHGSGGGSRGGSGGRR